MINKKMEPFIWAPFFILNLAHKDTIPLLVYYR